MNKLFYLIFALHLTTHVDTTKAMQPHVTEDPQQEESYLIASKETPPECRESCTYTLDALLDQGAFSNVFLTKEIANPHHCYAAKFTQSNRSKTILNEEINILKKLPKHPNIVKYIGPGFCLEASSEDGITEKVPCILLEYLLKMEQEDLNLKIRTSADFIREIITQLMLGLDFLHDHGIIHRDFKKDNIIITADGIVKIIDFGLSCQNDPKETTVNLKKFRCNEHYKPPEMLQNLPCANKVDIWAAGITLYRLLSESDHSIQNKRPFGTYFEENPETLDVLEDRIRNAAPYPLPETIPLKIQELIYRLLTKDQVERPSAFEILCDPFIRESLAYLEQKEEFREAIAEMYKRKAAAKQSAEQIASRTHKKNKVTNTGNCCC